MKKGLRNFLVFIFTAVTATCIGSVFYQFAKNDEIISVSANTVYVNYGESLSLDDIGFSRKKIDKHTKINFNAGGDEVASVIKFDELNNKYVVTDKGGATTIKITTTNRKYKSFTINVFVGLGTKDHPYYISNEKQLFNIGELFDINAHYSLVNDITVTEEHLPIGVNLIDNAYNYREFDGKFDGQFKTISGFKTTVGENAGLFGIIGSNGLVKNLTVKNFDINGSFTNAGAIAGISYGTINKIEVIDSNIRNTNENINSATGAIVGTIKTDVTSNNIATIISSMATTHNDSIVSTNGIVGGIAGVSDNAKIHACYTHLNLTNANSIAGGLVGKMIVGKNSYIYESYSISNLNTTDSTAGNIIGEIILADGVELKDIDKKMVLLGNYFNSELNSFDGVGSDNNKFTTSTSFTVMGRKRAELKSKSTYVYFLQNESNVVYWDKLWSLNQGQLPVIEKADVTPITPSINIENTLINALIGTKEELISKFNRENVTGNFILTNNIDLGGMTWNPVNFKGTFKADEGKSYTISNFKINKDSKYLGFFSILDEATIANITFANVEIVENGINQSVGTVAGFILKDTTIDNVHVNFANISTKALYTGGIVGYANHDANVTISNCYGSFIDIKGVNENVGGLVAYAGKNTTLIDCAISSKTGIAGTVVVGGIAATNYGVIQNCAFYGLINSTCNLQKSIYFGGIAGKNSGKILESRTNPNISVYNTSSQQSFIGGVAGYNNGTINNTIVSNETDTYTILSEKDSNNIYIGGLVGFNNKGDVVDSKCSLSSIGTTRKSTYTAGLVAYNVDGLIYGCHTTSNLLGDVVAGLVVFNSDNGVISSCFVGKSYKYRSTIEGNKVSGFVYSITGGKIKDCLVNSNLQCSSEEGWCVGFASFMPYDTEFGTIETSIANVSLSGIGKNFLDCQQSGLFASTRKTGSIINCIISEDANVEGVYTSTYDHKPIFLWFGKGEKIPSASGSNYVVATAEQLADINTYTDVNYTDFDISSSKTESTQWYFDIAKNYAMPRALVK